jgi:hypothetical protein
MRRHRHNLRADQLARLQDSLRPFPLLELVYRFQQRLCSFIGVKTRC